jgi:hypothetical protein
MPDPADAFYEWMRMGKAKQPYCFEVNEGKLFAFAGIWDRWKDPSGEWLKSCSILTTAPNTVTAAVHDRMPVILERDCYDLWLDPGLQNVAEASELLKPFDARFMRCYPVSTRVNHVGNDDKECSAPAEVAETQRRGIGHLSYSQVPALAKRHKVEAKKESASAQELLAKQGTFIHAPTFQCWLSLFRVFGRLPSPCSAHFKSSSPM